MNLSYTLLRKDNKLGYLHKTTEISYTIFIQLCIGYFQLFLMEGKLSSVRKQIPHHYNVVMKAHM